MSGELCGFFTSDYHLVQTEKDKVVYDLPILIGFFVYNYTKLSLLKFYYSFLLKALKPDQFEMVQVDTDSAYLALCAETIEDAFEEREEMTYLQFLRLQDQFIENDLTKRQPGYFKLEWQGNAFIALNSKCYIGESDDYGQKLSCKGIIHTQNPLSYEDFKRVPNLEDDFLPGTNRGFRLHSGHLETYEQDKTALTHFYIKRKILDKDDERTYPLDI